MYVSTHSGFGRVACPEGSSWNGSACQCHSGRVWTDARDKCVSPQYLAIMAGESVASQTERARSSGTPFSQTPLNSSARRYIESRGHSVSCRIDPNWREGPQGGDPARLCSIDGGRYEHAAYALNANPSIALPTRSRSASTPTNPTGSRPTTTSSGNPVPPVRQPSTPPAATTPPPAATTPPSSTQPPASTNPPPSSGPTNDPPSNAGGPTPDTAPPPDSNYYAPTTPYVPPAEWIAGVPTWALLAGGLFAAATLVKR